MKILKSSAAFSNAKLQPDWPVKQGKQNLYYKHVPTRKNAAPFKCVQFKIATFFDFSRGRKCEHFSKSSTFFIVEIKPKCNAQHGI